MYFVHRDDSGVQHAVVVFASVAAAVSAVEAVNDQVPWRFIKLALLPFCMRAGDSW